jgi:hypothetical protein
MLLILIGFCKVYTSFSLPGLGFTTDFTRTSLPTRIELYIYPTSEDQKTSSSSKKKKSKMKKKEKIYYVKKKGKK